MSSRKLYNDTIECPFCHMGLFAEFSDGRDALKSHSKYYCLHDPDSASYQYLEDSKTER